MNVILPLLSTVTPPVIDVQPSDQCGPATFSATFEVETTGEGMLSYQWFGPRGVLTNMSSKIEGSDDVHLMIFNVSKTDVGNYQVVVTNRFGATVTSNMAFLQICKLCTSSGMNIIRTCFVCVDYHKTYN